MRKTLCIGAILLFSVSLSLTMNADRAAAQGPAGAGASAAAQDSHFVNPIKWIKKDSNNSTSAPGSRSDAEKKLTTSLQAQGVLAANATATEACSPFTVLEGCLAALHASHNLGVDFNCLRAEVTGVHTSADMSGCKTADGEKNSGSEQGHSSAEAGCQRQASHKGRGAAGQGRSEGNLRIALKVSAKANNAPLGTPTGRRRGQRCSARAGTGEVRCSETSRPTPDRISGLVPYLTEHRAGK